MIVEADGCREGLTQAYEEEMRQYATGAVKTSYGFAMQQFGVQIDETSDVVTGHWLPSTEADGQ